MEYVYQLFADIALLVKNQTEELDNIETNLKNAKNYLEKAERKLIIAKEQHQKNRKKMCCILIIGLLIIVIIVIPISLKLTTQA